MTARKPALRERLAAPSPAELVADPAYQSSRPPGPFDGERLAATGAPPEGTYAKLKRLRAAGEIPEASVTLRNVAAGE